MDATKSEGDEWTAVSRFMWLEAGRAYVTWDVLFTARSISTFGSVPRAGKGENNDFFYLPPRTLTANQQPPFFLLAGQPLTLPLTSAHCPYVVQNGE